MTHDGVDPVVPGATFGPYVIGGRIGSGGMSIVYRATDTVLERTVALKVLAPELAGDPGARRQFAVEAQVASALDHPNVLPVYGSGEEDGRWFIAMRHLDGGTDLRELLDRRGSLGAGAAAEVVGQVGAALDALHRSGWVHGDVAPGNVLLDTAGGSVHAYLCDFGLASPLGEATADAHQARGTLAYVAPEALRGERVGAQADVYALTCVLHECLVGSPPFVRDDDASLLYAKLHATPPAVTAVRADLAPAVDDVVRRGLAGEPSDRPSTCRELVAAFNEAMGPGRDGEATAEIRGWSGGERPTLPEVPPPTAAPRRRRGMVVALAVVAVLAVVAGAAVVTARRGTDPGVADVAAGPARGGTATAGLVSLPPTWNPLAAPWSPAVRHVAATVFDPLVVVGADGPEPYLAEGLAPAPDFTSWAVTLRSGARFHDGTAADAEAVRTQLEAARNTPPFRAQLAPVRSVRVDGPARVVIETDQPWPSFGYTLATQVGFLAAPTTWTAAPPDLPIGTGPFRMTGQRPDGATLERSADYWQADRPYLDRLDVRAEPSFAARLRSAQEGQLAVVEATAAEGDDPRLRGGHTTVALGPDIAAVALNVGREPMGAPELRQVLATARPEVGSIPGATAAATSPFVLAPWQISDAGYPSPDPTTATDLAGGLPEEVRGEVIELLVPPTHRQTGNAVIESWRRAGIRVNAVDTPSADLWPRIEEGDYDAAVVDVPSVADPDQVRWLFHSGAGGDANVLGLTAPGVDAPFDAGRVGNEPAARTSDYQAAVQAINEIQPMVWLGQGADIFMVFEPAVVAGPAADATTIRYRPLFTDLAVAA